MKDENKSGTVAFLRSGPTLTLSGIRVVESVESDTVYVCVYKVLRNIQRRLEATKAAAVSSVYSEPVVVHAGGRTSF